MTCTNTTPDGTELKQVAADARDGFLTAWDFEMDENKWDIHGDELAHINHIAEGDYGLGDVKVDHIEGLIGSAREMNVKASESVAPLNELKQIVDMADRAQSE